MVKYATINKDNEIDNYVMQRHKDHELGLKYASFKLTLVNDMKN